MRILSRNLPWVFVALTSAVMAVGFWLVGGAVERAINPKIELKIVKNPQSLQIPLDKTSEKILIEFPIRNTSSASVTLLGGTFYCDCFIPANVPLEIPPRSERILKMQFNPSGAKTGEFTLSGELLWDQPTDRHEIVVNLSVLNRSTELENIAATDRLDAD